MPKDEVWVTKDGRRIEVKDLEEEHCREILRMLIRNARRRRRREALKAQIQEHVENQCWQALHEDRIWGKS